MTGLHHVSNTYKKRIPLFKTFTVRRTNGFFL
jgi:hypothetical protein